MTWLAVLAALRKLWAFLKSPVGRLTFGAAGLLLIAALIYQGGVSAGEGRERAAEAKRVASAMKAVRKTERAAVAITAKTEAKTAERLVEIRTVTKTLTKEIPVYVSPEVDRSFLLPNGLVWMRDQAAAGVSEIPAHPGELSDAASQVPASAFAEAIVLDYGAAYEWREAALACRSWVSEQAANFNSNIRTPEPAP